MKRTSGFRDVRKPVTSDLLNLRRLSKEFAFQQQMDRMFVGAAAPAFDGALASSSRARF
jgi:hypothetical protein